MSGVDPVELMLKNKEYWQDIERLKASQQWWEETSRIKTHEIVRLKALCARAAGALDDLERFSFYCYSEKQELKPLLSELREAAK